jgi:CheY-specific phosphatase CheX
MTVKTATLAEVISEVIENLSMMPVGQPTKWENFHPQLEGWIEFTGPVKGKLTLQCEEALAQALAANLLGTDCNDFQTQNGAWDALAELLNVVCGNLVTVLYDAKKPFSLSAPQINIIPPTQSDDISDERDVVVKPESEPEAQQVRILVDTYPIEFVLKLKK